MEQMASMFRPAIPRRCVTPSVICSRFLTEAARLGANARQTVESEMSLDLWAERISTVIRQVAMRSAF